MDFYLFFLIKIKDAYNFLFFEKKSNKNKNISHENNDFSHMFF